MDVIVADRLQFAFTIMFHYLFPIGTMGLAPFVAWYAIVAARTGSLEAARATRFWAKIFAVNFAIGVVTGIPMEFQFGTNWASFSAFAGGVIGTPLAMEGVYAFFLESIFLGILLYGQRIVSQRLYCISAVCVWLGSWLSGYFITVTNAWMQHPVGYTMLHGRIEMTNLWQVLTQEYAVWQYLHVICGAVVTGGFILAGIGAFYLLARRDETYGRMFLRDGTIVALVFSVLVVFPTGDRNSASVTADQPIKLAAMEGLFASTNGAPLAIIGMPDMTRKTLIDPIFVPDVLSFLAYGNFNANVKGLSAYATVLWPPVELTYYAYHVMVGLGTIFLGTIVIAALLLWRKVLFTARWMLWIIMLVMPFPYIANEAGWVTAEVGRQPWLIYGIMQTVQGSSPTVGSGETLFSLIGFIGMYFLLGLLFMILVLREIGIGPGEPA